MTAASSPQPLKIATLAERVQIGRTVYPPKVFTRGISKQAWKAVDHGREFLLIRRHNEHRQIHHSTKVLVLVSEDPNLA
jgi:hypothetical protein